MDEKFQTLGDRIKSYENQGRIYLKHKIPVILRIDGKAFHSFTRKMNKPFDDNLLACMRYATVEVSKEISGCKFSYTQSDEASFLITDLDSENTEGWFKYNKSKIESVSASMFTYFFNKKYQELFNDPENYALFDARSFNISNEEVVNYFTWRQWDATRNAIQMVARANFSHGECNKKNTLELKEMLLSQKEINFEEFALQYKRGVAFYKESTTGPNPYHEKFPHNTEPVVTRNYWKEDLEIPQFSKEKDFIENLLKN